MKLRKVHQQLVSRPLADINKAVHRQLSSLNLSVPKGDVALTVGSRGISNLPLIIKACGDWLREHGATPFIVPRANHGDTALC